MTTKSFKVVQGKDLHIERGRQLLRAHPQLKQLIGPYPLSSLYIALILVAQLGLGSFINDKAWYWTLLVAYTFGACFNLALFSMIHEVSHGLVFKRPTWNYLIGFVANFSLFIPLSVNYRYYHLAHHRFIGQARRDVDMPTIGEAAWVGNLWWRKILWLVFFFWPYGVVRSLRNMSVPKFDRMIGLNCIVQFAFLTFVYLIFGLQGLSYFALSTLFSISLSPAFGARGLLEHFVVSEGQETYSYYGPYNRISFNNGYHHEHHDLIGIPWVRLPFVRKICITTSRILLWFGDL